MDEFIEQESRVRDTDTYTHKQNKQIYVYEIYKRI